MKKKGFTLIELLAVIVILAIIALIATPIVMNVIENSKKGAAERSAENYLRAVETAIASERLDGPVEDGKYEVDVNGTLPEKKGTIVVIVNGLVAKTQVIIVIGEYTVKENEEGKLEASKNEAGSNNTVTVYRLSTEEIRIGQEIDPSDTTKFTTDPTTLGKNYYLKHTVENNVVTESYVCAVFNDKETCVRGVSADYYGYAENVADYTGNALILKGLQDEGLRCDLNELYSKCEDGSVILVASKNGMVDAYDDNGDCYVYGGGNSFCIIY